MVSTPPRVSGSPEAEAHRRWVEEQLCELRGGASVTQKRVAGIAKQATISGNIAANAASDAATAIDRTVGQDSTNRLARPITDGEFWKSVTAGTARVWTLPGADSSTSRNVTWNPGGGFTFQPNSETEGAEIDITPILPTPASGSIYVEAKHHDIATPVPEIHVQWRYIGGEQVRPDDPNYPTSTVVSGSGTVKVPVAGGVPVPSYSVKLVRLAGTGLGAAADPKVFEVIGTGGVNIGPEGIAVEGSNGQPTVEINPTLPLLDPPTAPILSSKVGTVAVHWNGSLSTGPTPGHLSYVFAEEAASSTGPWLRVGQPLNRAGDVIVSPPVGSTRWYRFTAVDTSNRSSAPSSTQSIPVSGVNLPDLDDQFQDVLDDIAQTADNAWDAASVAATDWVVQYALGSSETVPPASGWSETAPVRTPGSLVWQKTIVTYGSGSTVETDPVLLTGNAGEQGPQGEPGGTGVSVTSVQNYYRATTPIGQPAPAAPTTTTPPSPWTLTEPAFAPNTELWATTRIGYSNSTFAYTPVSKVSAYTAAIYAQQTADGKNAVYIGPNQPVAPSSGQKQGDLWYETDSAATDIIGVRIWNGTAWAPYQFVADSIFVPGSVGDISLADGAVTAPKIAAKVITGEHIVAGSLSVNELSPSVGTDLQLGSNGSVTTIINTLSETRNDVADVAQAADAAAQAAAGAQADVNNVQGQVSTLEDQQVATADQVAAISTWFRVDAEGAHVGRSDSAFQAHVKPGRFEITENAAVTSYWEGGRLVVSSLETSEVVLVSHKFEPYGNGLVVRAIG